jgi:DNA-binding NtrC family response regulator
MSARIAIFEDDSDLAEHLSQLLEIHGYEVTLLLSLDDIDWRDYDIVFADYGNQIVPFKKVTHECQENEIPLIAISGGPMNYTPSLSKPFLIADMEAMIAKALSQRVVKKESIFSFFRRSS